MFSWPARSPWICKVGALLVTVGPGAFASAQLLHGTEPLPAFEVATVKPSASDAEPGSFSISFQHGFKATDQTVERLIEFAYGVRTEAQLLNEPKWARSTRFDVNARLDPEEVNRLQTLTAEQRLEQFKLMVQSLLKERFALKPSYEERVMPVYELYVARSGPRLKEASDAGAGDPQKTTSAATTALPSALHPPTMDVRPGHLQAGWVSMRWFAQWLPNLPEIGARTVVDSTGLTGLYDFALHWTPEDAPPGDPAASATALESVGPAFATALQEQLGLKLIPGKAEVEVLVIQHLEPPSEN